MREILFRGKRLDNGEWVEGWYQPETTITHYDGRKEKIGVSIAYKIEDGFLEDALVDPYTVGQYTGLHDATKWDDLSAKEQREFLHDHKQEEWNGKRIFEGDILRWTGEDGETGKVIVIFAGGAFLMKCVEVPDAPADPFDEFERGGQTLEIIGNIHDNQKLMKG